MRHWSKTHTAKWVISVRAKIGETTTCGVVICLVALAFPNLTLSAQEKINSPEIDKAVSQLKFQAVDAEALSRKRDQLAQKLAALESLLGRSKRDYATGWKRYLNWEVLTAISDDQKYLDTASNRNATRAAIRRLTADHAGLEMRQFVGVREALESYLDLSVLAQAKNAETVFGQRIKALRESLPKLADSKTASEALNDLASGVKWMIRFNQGEQVAKEIQKHFAQPNLYASISGTMLESSLVIEVENEQDIRDTILGTAIVGKAKTTGEVKVKLVPDNNSISARLHLTGTANSQNRGYNRGVTVFSRGVTSINAHTTVVANANGMTTHGTTACCETDTTFTGICARSNLVEKIAWKQAYKSKGQAEAIASRKAERRVIDSLNQQAGELIQDANDRFVNQFLNPLKRKGHSPNLLRLSSTDKSMDIVMTQASRGQLAASSKPKPIDGDHDISVQLHESMVANLGEAAAGGFTLTDENLTEVLKKYAREVPAELEKSDTSWGITFSRDAPIRVRFEDGNIQVGIRISSIIQNGRVAVRTLSVISTEYKVSKTDSGVLLERQGDVEVRPVQAKQIPVREIAAYKLVRSKFRALFKERIEREGFQLQGQLEDLGTFRLSSAASSGGWLNLAWRRNGTPAVAKVAARQ